MVRKKAANLDFIEIAGDPDGLTIMLLHGFGASAEDLASLHTNYQASARPTWIFPNAPLQVPLAPGWVGHAWFNLDIEGIQKAFGNHDYRAIMASFSPDLASARLVIEGLIEELGIEPSKLILGGFSQGAVLALETALHLRVKCAGLLLFSATLANEEKWREMCRLHTKTPFFQSHGTQDPLLPYSLAQKLETVLIEGGLIGKLHSFLGGHEIPPHIHSEMHIFLSKLLA